jgi:hypothetical protein
LLYNRKHFSWEDYDAWLYSEDGIWKSNATSLSYPHYLIIHIGLHTCVHAINGAHYNQTMITQHLQDINSLIHGITTAIQRTPTTTTLPSYRTTVIFQLAGRSGSTDQRQDSCTREFNRQVAYLAHEAGFIVFEREEIERRLLFKSEYWSDHRAIKPNLHLEPPGPQIVATALLGLIACLAKNETTISTTTSTTGSSTSSDMTTTSTLLYQQYRQPDI